MDIQDYQNQECNVIVEPQFINHMAIMTTEEIKRTECNNAILFTGTYDECVAWVDRDTPFPAGTFPE